MRPGTTEFALFMQFDCGLHAHMPLASHLRLGSAEVPFPVSIVFGDKDWMDSRGSYTIVSKNKFFEAGDSQLHILENAGHQLFMDNPEGFVKLVTDDLLGNIKGAVQQKPVVLQYVDDEGNVRELDDESKQIGQP